MMKLELEKGEAASSSSVGEWRSVSKLRSDLAAEYGEVI